ncbi:hypothetical protein HYH03_003230 [Edaphochlamys debaryana]|uniref:Kinetochore protein Spc24 n=1 Tax=Edaphochlamys debaryana TaxID=47281 RepID=A0A836C3Q1_9CHLO|nr:hypothetical protein HYH03_003230 [Edaphochlamys debaryana]|eukprot:KAG2499045.1 hypothetical protein HYH03_003230 [Edaphochlamys debaryana]
MARSTELFADEVQVMKALFQDYSKRTDCEAVATVEQDVSDICEVCSSREADARATIKELSRQVQDLGQTAAYPHREGLHAERVAALRRQIDQHQQVEEQLRAAQTSAQEAADMGKAEESLLRHQLSMYAHITRVTWRLDQAQAVAGTVSDSKSGDIRLFNFDPKTVSNFELVNALWELL